MRDENGVRVRTLAGVIALLTALVVLPACDGGAFGEPTPTTYFAPATPIFYIPPGGLSDPQSQYQVTTILFMGFDRRSGGGTSNTDSMMLFRIDPNGEMISVLSIPRDLYVDIPNHGQGRINTAYSWGERDGTGGLNLARRTVSAAVGVPVQHAALIDFQAFVTLIDTIGGIDVDVPYDIADPTFPGEGVGYDPFYLSAGHHHLDGATALKYARTRSTPGGDFSRTERQRQIVLAVRDRVKTLDLLPSLIPQTPELWSTLEDSYETDLALADVLDLIVVASNMPGDGIKTGAIDATCVTPWTTPNGAAVLLPNQVAIEALIQDLFYSSPESTATPAP